MRATKIEPFKSIVQRIAIFDEKFTGSMRLVGHFRDCLEPVIPELRDHHAKSEAGLGSIKVRPKWPCAAGKHETLPSTNSNLSGAPVPTVSASPITPRTLH